MIFSFIFPVILGFGIEDFDGIEIGTFYGGDLAYLKFTVFLASLVHRLLMADRTAPWPTV